MKYLSKQDIIKNIRYTHLHDWSKFLTPHFNLLIIYKTFLAQLFSKKCNQVSNYSTMAVFVDNNGVRVRCF